MNKKKWLLLSLVMMFTIVLVACGNSGETISENYSSDMKIETENEINDNVLDENTPEDVVEEDVENTETEETNENAETKDSEEADASEEPETEIAPEADETESDEPVEPDEPAFVVKEYNAVLYVKNPVNVRKGPSTDYEILGGLEKGKQIQVTGIVDTGWYCIQYNDAVAYVYSSYLIDEASYQAMIAKEEALAAQQQQQQQQPAPEQQQPAPEPQQPQVNPADYKAQVVAIMNQERANAGIGGITQNASLDAVAQIRAQEIVQSFSHTRPDGTSCFTALEQNGISYTAAGENIAAGYGTPAEVMTGWMNSDGHRANILNGSFGQVGIGYYTDPNGVYGTYWVQMFTN